MDEEDIEYFEEDIMKTDRIEGFIMEASGIFMMVYGQAVSPSLLQGLVTQYGATL